jgi:small-conductance mechanosensitive channel
MLLTKKAIEVTGTVDAQNQLILDEKLPITGPTRVRIVILLPDDADIDELDWLHSAMNNPAYDFLKEPEEDIYNLTDGRPFNDQR